MLNISLTRIDDRLIHGQVMTAWVHYIKSKRIIIVDNELSVDPFLKKVVKMSAPPEIKVDIFDVNNAISILKGNDLINENVILLVKSPTILYDLIENGVELKEINIGGMGARQGRKQMYRNISASEEEREILKKILDKGTKIYIQILPTDKAIPIDKYL